MLELLGPHVGINGTNRHLSDSTGTVYASLSLSINQTHLWYSSGYLFSSCQNLFTVFEPFGLK